MLNVFIIVLVGCDNKPKFDRVQALNEYSQFVEYAPYSRYIKKQTINTYLNDSIISTTTIYGDEKGRCTYSDIQFTNSTVFNSNEHIDYDKLKFSAEEPLFFISIKDGDVILDKQDRLIKQVSQDGKTSFLTNYEKNQIVSFLITSPTLNVETKYVWQKDFLINQTEMAYNSFPEHFYKLNKNITYDIDGKITQSESVGNFLTIQYKTISSYNNWNEYGDWTTETIIEKLDEEENELKVVREIEYW
ncbi:hypothetical protein [Gilliamella sp. Pra-s54]|uniref:hypothetical protein n=1 Tax=Gilliamella sp. Pra-s54 TaxID=2687314 RepID=UPI001365FA9F|nr:hypothetical protein [Gilliamella sp. Pra-s54]MWP29852.1 hypothetical protein [Gilliamella sp. Pra-s54]